MYNENRCHAGMMNRGRGGKFGHRNGSRFGQYAQHRFWDGLRHVPANIEETDENFIIDVFAPALIKAHLKVVTKDDVLTISYTPTEDDTASKFSRREYSNGAFERAFALNGKVLHESISARYADGILKVILPKNPETNIAAKDVAVD
ncbi:Hsp20/alpha crystallin family protein [Pedobacter endophyticus]|uniref:Hsp20/alpha crystallin family protein n=1 Tax=Pedobacter endophyticus TaxID=2789740 RepID=A0A7U3SPI3_9SPHI|nr:Hsp20/alpha crystallin family protein [Pedobacter endophyticus]QPH37954.1 Hsp20/alpha crystallin family protein [Pedobacter endophyticus]